MTRRKAGKLRFFDIKDWSGRIQLLVSRGDLSEEQWKLVGALDLGDLVGIDGFMKRTDSGEISIFVEDSDGTLQVARTTSREVSRGEGYRTAASSAIH